MDRLNSRRDVVSYLTPPCSEGVGPHLVFSERVCFSKKNCILSAHCLNGLNEESGVSEENTNMLGNLKMI